MRVTRDGNGNVDTSANKGPDETRNVLSPVRKDLHSEGHGVDVRAVIRNDREGKNDQAELAKGAKVRDKNRRQKATGAGGRVTSLIDVVATVEISSSHDGHAQHLGEEQREDQANEGTDPHLPLALVRGVVDSVVGSVGGPSSGKAINGAAKAEDTAHFGSTNTHRNVHEIA